MSVSGTIKRARGELHAPYKQWSFLLRDAVLRGIIIQPDGIVVSVISEIAPYWQYVHEGHRVVMPLPDGSVVETGGFVHGRPFMDEIVRRLQTEGKQKIETAIRNHVKNIGETILSFIRGGSAGQSPYGTVTPESTAHRLSVIRENRKWAL